jgi:chromosome segregation ATPase
MIPYREIDQIGRETGAEVRRLELAVASLEQQRRRALERWRRRGANIRPVEAEIADLDADIRRTASALARAKTAHWRAKAALIGTPHKKV